MKKTDELQKTLCVELIELLGPLQKMENIRFEIGVIVGWLSRRYDIEIIREELVNITNQNGFWEIIRSLDGN